MENGRVKDEGTLRMRSCLRALVERFRPEVRLTPGQDVLLCGLDANALGTVERFLDEFGVPRPEVLPLVQRYSLACPAIPTCGLAISEAERALPTITDELASVLNELGLSSQAIDPRSARHQQPPASPSLRHALMAVPLADALLILEPRRH